MVKKNSSVPHHFHILFNIGTIGALTDGQLLERFATGGGEARELAFAALVERHGPLVFRICRAVLGDEHDAADAFQATFFALARKAESLWTRDSVSPWLHQAAYRAACHDRSARTRRRVIERAAILRPECLEPDGREHDFETIIHEEINHLPERYRVVVVLCDLEGRTHEQAAQHMGCAVGTVKSRLSRGREKLRGRLMRRGMAPSAGIVTALAVGAGRAPALSELAEATVRYAAGGRAMVGTISATVAALPEGVLMSLSMFLTKFKMVAMATAVLAGLVAGLICAIMPGGACTIALQLDNRQDALHPNAAHSGTEKQQPAGARPDARPKTPLDVPSFPRAGFHEDTTLDDGVKRFNDRAKTLGLGVNEPLLTKDEVVAAIRGWIPPRESVEPNMLKSFQRVAETGILPAGSSLRVTTHWSGYNGYFFDVWWIDLDMPKTADGAKPDGQKVAVGYTFRIRDRKLKSRALTQQEKEGAEKALKRRAQLKLEKTSAAPK